MVHSALSMSYLEDCAGHLDICCIKWTWNKFTSSLNYRDAALVGDRGRHSRVQCREEETLRVSGLVSVILLQLQHGVQLVSQVGEHGADIVKDVAGGSENGKSLSYIIVT